MARFPAEQILPTTESFPTTGALPTKDRLFDRAIELFSLHGYENVSINNISNAAGIQGSSFYNHFISKEALLDEIYSCYETHFFHNAKSGEEVREVLRTGSAEEVMAAITWNFYGMPAELHRRMTQITKIVYSRFLIDERARHIFLEHMTRQTVALGVDKLQLLVEFGRLPADTDSTAFAEIIAYTTLMTGIVGIATDYSGGLVDDKTYLREMLTGFLAHSLDRGGHEPPQSGG